MTGSDREEMIVTVQTVAIIDILRGALKMHRDRYLQAMVGYRRQAVEELHDRIAAFGDVHTGDEEVVRRSPTVLFPRLNRPISHERDYLDAIAMLEMHAEPTIRLTMTAYRRYANDQWEWRGAFEAVTQRYL